MAFFSYDKPSKLGIDIGTASIKIAELVKSSNRFELANYGMSELEPGDDTATAKIDNKDVVDGIRSIMSAARMKTKDVVASIPSFPTFSTTLTLPYLSREELAKAMPFEARKYIPIPLSEVQLDWAVVDVRKESIATPTEAANAAKPMIDVFLVAVPKVEVVRYQSIMKDAGLNLRALELENFALIRSLIGNDRSPYVIVNVGGRSTSILIVDNGFERASRDYEVGGFEITKSIARALNVNIARAEELKHTLGIKNDEANIIRQSMSSLVDMMAFEVNKTIQNYEDQKKTKIANILLVGGMANMPEFVNYFGQKLGRSVAPGNPLARVLVPPSLESMRGELNATFVVSIGLAMREI